MRVTVARAGVAAVEQVLDRELDVGSLVRRSGGATTMDRKRQKR